MKWKKQMLAVFLIVLTNCHSSADNRVLIVYGVIRELSAFEGQIVDYKAAKTRFYIEMDSTEQVIDGVFRNEKNVYRLGVFSSYEEILGPVDRPHQVPVVVVVQVSESVVPPDIKSYYLMPIEEYIEIKKALKQRSSKLE